MCIFCDIINKQAPAKIRYEDDEILAFDAINPKAKIHILIVPKKHFETLNEIPDTELEIISKMFKVAKKLAIENNIDNGYKLVMNNGKQAGQIIFHIHLHLLGGNNIGNV